MDWKQYEYVTRYVYETLGKKSGVKIMGYGNNCLVQGKSGVQHQIDVLTKHSDGIHSYLTAIECKYWKEKVNKDIVMKVSEIIEDAGIDKGVIVSKNGFTSDGISYAKHKNIGLVELREAVKSEKPINKIYGVTTEIYRPIVQTQLICDGNQEIGKYKYTESSNIILSNGSSFPLTKNIYDFEIELQKEEFYKQVHKDYIIQGARLIDQNQDIDVPISKIVLIGMLIKIETDLKFKYIDQVWLIMKLHFEEKIFSISEKGEIRQIK